MCTQVTVTLPDDTNQRAVYLAQRTGRVVADVLAETINLFLRPLRVPLADEPPPAERSDSGVLALVEAQMDLSQDRRLSDLLTRQRAGALTADERVVLLGLLQVYQDGLLRKAQALRQAVLRGLRPPLEP